jgi:hypothetical protein
LPLPSAGQKIGNYYRKLFRRRGESAIDFLIRKDNVHDEMRRALQRLLKDMDVKWEDYYGYSKRELENVLAGLDEDDDGVPWPSPARRERTPEKEAAAAPDEIEAAMAETRPRSSRGARQTEEALQTDSETPAKARHETASQADSWSPWAGGWWETGSNDKRHRKPKKQEKDLTQKLMQKGLVPLAAFDVIRGWRLLEMMAFTDTEKHDQGIHAEQAGLPQCVAGLSRAVERPLTAVARSPTALGVVG